MYDKWNSRLENVTWGYRDKFAEVLKRLEETGQLDIPDDDPGYKAFDKTYMELVGKNYCTDHVADVFLQSLDRKLSWIISIPELMECWGNYGLKLLNDKLYYAIQYFELWNKNLIVTDPLEMRFIMTTLQLIEDRIDVSSALAFLEGYPLVREVLTMEKVHNFVEEGINMFSDKPKIAGKFFKLELTSSKKMIELISKRCCLKNVNARLERLFKGICGFDFKIEDTTKLDTDELIEKGSTTICFSNSLFLPMSVTVFDSADLNTKWYLASIYTNAFAHLFKGFPTVHGMPGFESSEDFLINAGVESDIISQEMFYILDIYRILSAAFQVFPGAGSIVRDILMLEIGQNLSSGTASLLHIILYRLLLNENVKVIDKKLANAVDIFAQKVKEKILICSSFYDLISILPEIREYLIRIFVNDNVVLKGYKGILSFYSDYSYRSGLEQAPEGNNKLIDNNDGQKDKSDNENNDEQKDGSSFIYSDNKKIVKEKKETESKEAGYIYDEWNNDTQDYLHEWCCLHEISSFYIGTSYSNTSMADKEQVKNVRQVFERLKPDFMKKQKNLPIGDDVVLNILVNYLVEKKARLCPEEKIYCKDYKDERDIATALLIDISGSTADNVGEKEVLEIEKSAAFLLAEGLKELGDKFGIFGFSGSGRERCSFYVFKKFEEDWKEEQQKRLIACRPSGSTRIGVAIRHTTEKLKKLDSQRKLIIVITDGKPQDSDGYTTEGLYAQHDVRMACIEAKRNGIVVFCLSTENNSLNELELMFPVNRYIIMRSITELPQLLAKSYIKLTI